MQNRNTATISEVGTQVLTVDAMKEALGISRPVPLSAEAMAKTLRVTFFPATAMSPRLASFVGKLDTALREAGVQVLPFAEALQEGVELRARHEKRKLKEGIVVIAAGELETGNLPVDYVSNLRTTTVVGIVDGPCPGNYHDGMQEKLNSIVRTLAWNIAQVVIFVEDDLWTISTMNGAVIPCRDRVAFSHDVASTLVPKLAAPVVPPHSSDYDVDDDSLDLTSDQFAPYVQDFKQSGPLWGQTGLMLFHTSLETLEFRSPFYKRIAAAYLDRRSGMSYGFLARQVAMRVHPAFPERDADDRVGGTDWRSRGFAWVKNKLFVSARLHSGVFLVEVPDVSVLSTRSGCDKAHIDGERDLMLLTLSGGRIRLKTPDSRNGSIDYRPSYDTLTILAHALGNALVAGMLLCIEPTAGFARTLQNSGMALAHWHGTINPQQLPSEYAFHGEQNPPVSCSTHQSGIYALGGKLEAFRSSTARGTPFHGDVHVEPHHGINVTWPTLTGLAELFLRTTSVRHPAEAVDRA